MGILSRLAWFSRRSPASVGPVGRRRRRYGVEQLERRQLMAVDVAPIQLGSVYFEDGTGEDQAGDTLDFTFSGGAPGTQLTRLTIDTDKLGDGLTIGDVFFDTAAGGAGAFDFAPLQVISQQGIDSLNFSVADGGTTLVFDFVGFEAGDRLTIRIDVDEQGFKSANAVAEGNEFEGSKLLGEFTAPHYQDASGQDIYLDDYDGKLASSGLSLPPDSYVPPGTIPYPVYTAGAIFALQQRPLPISLSGVVYEDLDQDNTQDSGEPGLGGVTLSLLEWDGDEYVSTGRTAVTDPQGHYKFDDLLPGKYRVVETQPPGFLSVGAQPGQVGGSIRGASEGTDIVTEIELLGGEDSIRNDFGEIRPASIAGRVHADLDGDCVVDPGEAPLEGVTIWLLDASGARIASTLTDADGNYLFDGLRPGTYGIEEIQPAGYLHGDEHPGSAGGNVVSADKLAGIVLTSGLAAIDYNFCEVPPAKLAGFVYVDSNNNGTKDAGEAGIAGVTMLLLDADCQPTGTTVVTDANGMYMFANLLPGSYGVRELHPPSYLDGLDSAGTAGGTPENPGDEICSAILTAGQQATDYNFGELLPAAIAGRVFADVNGDCIYDPGESVIPGVTVRLFDPSGTLVASTTTDSSGEYRFDGLRPGTYRVVEDQPAGYLQGGTLVGSAGGTVLTDDQVGGIVLGSGQTGTEYNFCEVAPAGIAGRVFADQDGDCVQDAGEAGIAGVTIELFDSGGSLVATTTTDAAGQYAFTNLLPGTYTVLESQPTGYFQGGQVIGTAGGSILATDRIGQIALAAGEAGVEYNFCEILPASLSGYVFQDGPTIYFESDKLPDKAFDLTGVRDGKRDSGDKPLAGQRVVLGGRNGEILLDAEGNPIETFTDANGFYQFANLFPGTYSVLQTAPPSGYLPGIDTAGSTGGVTFNFGSDLNPLSVLSELDISYDPIALVQLAPGANSVENNFSEVLVATQPPKPPGFFFENPGSTPVVQFVPSTPIFGAPASGQFFGPARPLDPPLLFGAAGAPSATWHLSVINGGQPRAERPGEKLLVQKTKARSWATAWNSVPLDQAVWEIDRNGDGRPERVIFGAPNGIPLSGDFDGDGRDEVAVFVAGQWFVDLNGDGAWSDDDLWARLGTAGDQPVAGDWDGDGKTDIGIFGAEWPEDPHAIAAEPGLPDAQNSVTGDPKNLPPERGQATLGERLLQRTISEPIRSDLIDHVFHFGQEGDAALTGDWNGDGVASIGIYRGGRFLLDTNGNGRIDGEDRAISLNIKGRPVVGDFDGDGRDEVGIYQHGTWRIDSDHDGQLAAHDQVIEMGDAGSLPVVGDWNGDGVDEPGLYRPQAQ